MTNKFIHPDCRQTLEIIWREGDYTKSVGNGSTSALSFLIGHRIVVIPLAANPPPKNESDKFSKAFTFYCYTWGPGVGIATRYGLEGPGIKSRWVRNFPEPFILALRATQPPVQWIQGVKRPGRGVDHPPASTAEFKGRVELYLYSRSGTSWPVLGWTQRCTNSALNHSLYTLQAECKRTSKYVVSLYILHVTQPTYSKWCSQQHGTQAVHFILTFL